MTPAARLRSLVKEDRTNDELYAIVRVAIAKLPDGIEAFDALATLYERLSQLALLVADMGEYVEKDIVASAALHRRDELLTRAALFPEDSA